MNYGKLTEEQQKKLKSIERRLLKINKEILQMGFNVYLSNDTCNIMDGDSHNNNSLPIPDNVMHSFTLRGWDGGDW